MSLCVEEEEIGLKGENAVCFLMQFNCYFSFPVLIHFYQAILLPFFGICHVFTYL